MNGTHTPRNKLVLLLVAMAALTCGTAVAADFTVVNNCSYTVYPGIFPATDSNGGWQMAPGARVNFTLNSGWIGQDLGAYWLQWCQPRGLCDGPVRWHRVAV